MGAALGAFNDFVNARRIAESGFYPFESPGVFLIVGAFANQHGVGQGRAAGSANAAIAMALAIAEVTGIRYCGRIVPNVLGIAFEILQRFGQQH